MRMGHTGASGGKKNRKKRTKRECWTKKTRKFLITSDIEIKD